MAFTAVKQVSRTLAVPNDEIVYTMFVNNVGPTLGFNVLVVDTLPTGVTYVEGSLMVNGATVVGSPLPPGYTIGTIAVGQAPILTFRARVSTIPASTTTLANSYSLIYSHIPFGTIVTASNLSNTVNTVIPTANLSGITKSVSKTWADLSDQLNYTITIPNNGGADVGNLIFNDTIPLGTNFIANSFKLNNVTITGVNPQNGINIGTILVGRIATVNFSVQVVTIPTINPILNSAVTSYNSYGGPGVKNISNTVQTQVNNGDLDIIKSVDFSWIRPGGTITYTLLLKNSGSVSSNNVTLIDTIPNGTAFVPNSVQINGVTITGTTPQGGINIGTISAGGSSIVTFIVTVDSPPTVNPILNSAITKYFYTSNPSIPNGVSKDKVSNVVTTQITTIPINVTIPNDAKANFSYIVDPSTPIIGSGITTTSIVNNYLNTVIIDKLIKYVDKPYADVGQTITYTIAITNSGGVSANNVIFKDTIPNYTTFVANSVQVNGVTVSGSVAPPTGINIGTIAGGGTSTVTFKVVINTIPSPNPIPNSGNLSYNYTVIPTIPNGASGSKNTNIVQTQVNNANLTLTKARDLAYGDIGTTITYTIAIKNVGNVSANNILFTDTIPNGTSFVANSVQVDGVSVAGSPAPGSGINVGTISSGGVSTVTFKVLVTTIPTPNPIPNTSTARYNYTVDPSVPNGTTGGDNSNTVQTQINNANLDMVKTGSPSFADKGTTITYTIVVRNLGNVAATSVNFTDTIPSDITFVANSVQVNGVTVSGTPTPPNGINIGTIPAGGVSTVTFKVAITTIPSENPIKNSATTNFKYTVDPSVPNGATGGGNSNVLLTPVNKATLFMTKSTSLNYADVGNTITYTIVLNNVGNLSANNVIFTDTIPTDTTFVANSVQVNGVTVSGSPAPPTGISLGTIAAAGTSTVTFKVVVNTIPSPNPIPNYGVTNYKYTVDPSNPNGASGTDTSNKVFTQVNNAKLQMNKLTSIAYGDVSSTITYTVVVKNIGNVAAASISFIDTIPNDTTLVPNSVQVDGFAVSGSPAPPNGIPMGPIAGGGGVSTVTFKVVVNTIPSPNPIPNVSTARYYYTVDPSTPNGGTGLQNSNTVQTQINNANLEMSKTSSPSFVDVGSTITYTIVLKNVGNVAATTINLIDTIPNDTTFVANSVQVNGSTVLGSPAPPNGVNVGTVPAGGVSTVTFKVVVNTIPSPNPIINNATTKYKYTIDPSVPNGGDGGENASSTPTQVNSATLIVSKATSAAYTDVGATLTYTIIVKNIGNVAANKVFLTDTIPNDTTFVPNSILVNGSSLAGNVAPPIGVNIGTIAVGGTSTVTFNVVVNTIPSPNPMKNSATTAYNYTVDPSVPNGGSKGANTNIVQTQVNNANLELTKISVPRAGTVGTTITYYVVVKNVGNVSANNINFTDTIPNDTIYLSNSFKINNVTTPGSPAPPTGINIGTIAAGGITTVSFQVVVDTIPSPNPIENTGVARYSYTVDPSVPNGVNTSDSSNTVYTPIRIAYVPLVKSASPAYADIGTTITYTIVLENTGNVSANNIVFTDTIPNDTTFVANSVKVDGVSVAGTIAPPTGINLATMAQDVTRTVTFQVVVNTIPSPNPIPNTGRVDYKFTVDPSLPNGESRTNLSNTVNTPVSSGSLDITKYTNLNYGDVGSTITYTIVITNAGNVTLNQVVFTDTIPNDTTFVTDSVEVNDRPVPGSPAPPTGIDLGSLDIGTVYTITFMVTVNTIPTPNPIKNTGTIKYKYTIDPSNPNGASGGANTNTVQTQINNANLVMSKVSSASFVDVGTTITYTIVVRNVGNVSANSVKFTDTIPVETPLVPNSVQVNGTTVVGSPEPPTGLDLGTMPAGAVNTVTFKVLVNTIPSPNPIKNTAITNYKYTVDPSVPNGVNGTDGSNTTTTKVNNAKLIINKSVDETYVTCGATLTYTITIRNTGNTSALSTVFKDTIPNGTQFITNSLMFDGVTLTGQSPNAGVSLGTMAAGQLSTITFKVKVTCL